MAEVGDDAATAFTWVDLLDLLVSLEFSASRRGAQLWQGQEVPEVRCCPQCFGLIETAPEYFFPGNSVGHRKSCHLGRITTAVRARVKAGAKGVV